MTIKPDSIPLARPNISDAEIEAVTEVLRTPRLSLGPKLGEFESAFADYCNTREAVACSSGTAGLHLTLLALDVKPGDEVVTTPFSFVASANCILMTGAKPVFADIDPNTWNIDPQQIESVLRPPCKAIIAVDVFGLPADYQRIQEIASRHDLHVVEDSCEALGSKLNGKPAGAHGRAGVFAFYPNKQLTTGEGGMIVTDDHAVAQRCRSLRNQGRDEGGEWLAHLRMGYNYRLSDLNCALGLAQLRRIGEILAERRRVRSLYETRLGRDQRICLQSVSPGVEVSWFVFVLRLCNDYTISDRDRILEQLRARGVACSNYFSPIHLQPFYVERFGYRPGDFPVCEALSQRTVALPFHHELDERHVDRVCSELLSLL